MYFPRILSQKLLKTILFERESKHGKTRNTENKTYNTRKKGREAIRHYIERATYTDEECEKALKEISLKI